MEKSRRPRTRNSATQLRRLARERAEAQARRIPWQRLLHTRNEYIDWQEFYLWVRSILEVENRIPDWLVEPLNTRCPGFLENEKRLAPQAAKNRPLPLRLEDWIDEHVFGFAEQEGWFSTITFYAIREPRYQRAEVCWSESVEKWKKAKPTRYPSFDEWKRDAAKCDPAAHLLPNVRRAKMCLQLVDHDRLAEAVSRYIDWEAFAYWARSALEFGSELPAEVAHELEDRCPGFLEAHSKPRKLDSASVSQGWQQLMLWISDRFFSEAKNGGWFDAILIQAGSYLRAMRTREYADHCDELWSALLPIPYPTFEDWRRDADSYVEFDDN